MSTETREYAKKLTAQMTLEEKMSQMLISGDYRDQIEITRRQRPVQSILRCTADRRLSAMNLMQRYQGTIYMTLICMLLNAASKTPEWKQLWELITESTESRHVEAGRC